MATDVARLTTELQSKDKGLTELLAEKRTVSEMLNKLNAEVSEAQRELQRARHDKVLLECTVEDREKRIHISDEHRKITMQECDRLAGEVARLGTRVREVEDTEVTMANVSATMMRLIYDLQTMKKDIQQGSSVGGGAASPPKAQDIPMGEAPSGPLRDTVKATQSSTVRIQECLISVREELRKKVAADEELLTKMKKEHAEQAENFSKEIAQLRKLHENEIKQLQERNLGLEKQIGVVSDHSLRSKHEGLSVVDSISKENCVLKEKCGAYEKEFARLKDKVKRLKLDWVKVDDTRRRYRQLERERDLLKDTMTKVDGENVRLREYLVSMQGPVGVEFSHRGGSPYRTTHGAFGSGVTSPRRQNPPSPTRSIRSMGSETMSRGTLI